MWETPEPVACEDPGPHAWGQVCCMRMSLYFSVTCDPSGAVTLPNIGVPHCIGVPHIPAQLSSNGAHIRPSRPDSGVGFQVEVIDTLEVVPLLARKGEDCFGIAKPDTHRHFLLLLLDSRYRS